MNQQKPEYDKESGWKSCNPGVISRCRHKQPANPSRRDALITAGGVVGLVIGAVILRNQVINNIDRVPEAPYAIACVDVQAKLPAFITAELTPDLMMNMTTHLKDCQTCQVVYYDLGGEKFGEGHADRA